MFSKFKEFWMNFFNALKSAYNKTFKKPIENVGQEWRDTEKINFLDIFVSKLNNLVNNEATFSIISDSKRTEPILPLCRDILEKRFKITGAMLGEGDYYIFPITDSKGQLVHSYLTQQQVRILDMDGENITKAYGIIDWYVDEQNRIYYLLREHKIDTDGTLTISYSTVKTDGAKAYLEKWQNIDGKTLIFKNANHIGFGRYKSPADSRGLSPVYGVPLNFGCSDIENKIFNDLKLIDDEFVNGKSVVFADPLNLMPDEKEKCYKIAQNIIPFSKRPGIDGPGIEIFNPALRASEHYQKLSADMALYEKQVGTSRGILTDNEITATATATAVKRANSDTIALIGRIRNAIDNGNRMTLEADAVYLNIPNELWSYSADWFDPFTDPQEQWRTLIEAKNNGVAETSDLLRWQFPNLSEEDIAEKLERIQSEKEVDTGDALERMLAGR